MVGTLAIFMVICIAKKKWWRYSIDKQAVLGSMAEVITHSSQHFSDDDLNSIVTYVRSLSTVPVTQPAQLVQVSESAHNRYKKTPNLLIKGFL